MVNQTTIDADKKYPGRTVLEDAHTNWDVYLPDYYPPLYPKFGRVRELLLIQGIDIKTASALQRLATLSTRQAIVTYGEAIEKVRHPLGRTGINGTGRLWSAGMSRTADLAITRDEPDQGSQILLVFNRRKWRLPGGFEDQEKDGLNNRQATALREGEEETGLPLFGLADAGYFDVIREEHVKSNSSSSVDLAYISNYVGLLHLPEPRLGDDIVAQEEEVEAIAWFNQTGLSNLRTNRQISVDHFQYATEAFAHSSSTA